MRILVAVPTTGGPLLLRRLAPRPGLPHPAAFAEGDYRPLALSADYRALAGPEGPVARRLGQPVPPHELRLSGEPDGGASWEAPVALAHLLLADGGALAADPEGADVLLWATGALDLDLRLLPGDYALARKVDASRALLDAMNDRRTVAVLPPGPGRDDAAAALASLKRAVPVEVVLAETLGEALARLQDGPRSAGTATTTTYLAPRRASPLRWAATGGATIAAWILWALAAPPEDADDRSLVTWVELPSEGPDADDAHPDGPEPSEAARPTDPEPLLDDPAPAASGPESSVRSPDAPAQPTPEAPAASDLSAPAALIEEVRAVSGSSCRAALFDPALRVLGPVPREGAGYAASQRDPGLCGVALRPGAAGATLGPAEADPFDAFVAAPAADDAVVLFLRGPPRDVVYTVPVLLEDGPPATIEHRLVAPEALSGAPTE